MINQFVYGKNKIIIIIIMIFLPTYKISINIINLNHNLNKSLL
jgi:hypothetical protein